MRRRNTHPVDRAIRNLNTVLAEREITELREAARLRELAERRKQQDAQIAAQIPNHPW